MKQPEWVKFITWAAQALGMMLLPGVFRTGMPSARYMHFLMCRMRKGEGKPLSAPMFLIIPITMAN